MLRPACLLPAAQLSPPHGLLTPRSGTKVSLGCLGPATRRSDAYRDGTLTRWTCAACSSSSSPFRVPSSLCFVTHHGCTVESRPATGNHPNGGDAIPHLGDPDGRHSPALTPPHRVRHKPRPRSAGAPYPLHMRLFKAIPICSNKNKAEELDPQQAKAAAPGSPSRPPVAPPPQCRCTPHAVALR
jgi:hypothetical protein